jgi:hypothetical protein
MKTIAAVIGLLFLALPAFAKGTAEDTKTAGPGESAIIVRYTKGPSSTKALVYVNGTLVSTLDRETSEWLIVENGKNEVQVSTGNGKNRNQSIIVESASNSVTVQFEVSRVLRHIKDLRITGGTAVAEAPAAVVVEPVVVEFAEGPVTVVKQSAIYNGFEYRLERSGAARRVIITGYRGPGGSVSIPSTIEDAPVTSLERNAF